MWMNVSLVLAEMMEVVPTAQGHSNVPAKKDGLVKHVKQVICNILIVFRHKNEIEG